MKQIITILVLMLVTLTTLAQKVIMYPVSGEPFKAKLIKVGDKKVKYTIGDDVCVSPKNNIQYIQYEDKHIVNPNDVKDTLHSGSSLKAWSFDYGNGVSLGTKYETNYSYGPRLALGISHQWGYQLSNSTSIYLGGEYRMYNWSSVCDTTPTKRYAYYLNYLGANAGFHVLSIKSKANWFASFNLGAGARYYEDFNRNLTNDKKPNKVAFASHSTLNVGGSLKLGTTIFEAGPYVDYLSYGLGGNILSYGLKLTIISK